MAKKRSRDAAANLACMPYRPDAEASIRLTKEMKLPHVDVEEPVTVTVKGTVTAVRSDKYGKSLDVKVKSVDATTDGTSMKDDMERVRARRRRDEY